MQALIDENNGLDGVVAGATVLSHVDGEAGTLILRGYFLEEIAGRIGFEGIAALLWDNLDDLGADRDAVFGLFGQARVAAFALVPGLLQVTQGLTPIEALRAGLGMLPDEGSLSAHVRACGALPVFLPALLRRAEGKAPVAPDPSLGTAADLLRCLRGTPASAGHVQALDTYLTTIADHGFNASTFAARVVASTQAGMISSLIAGLCALKGPLHGGAPAPVLDMLDEIGTEARIVPWVEQAILAGDRLPGFGHRVYKVRDPRADVLKNVVRDLGSHAGRLAFAAAVEGAVIDALRRLKPGRRLDTNVEFYTALMLEAVGIPREAFTPLFAVGRAVGWSAHVMEQQQHGRLVRPLSRYIGPTPKAAA